jgi:hypothetical protein
VTAPAVRWSSNSKTTRSSITVVMLETATATLKASPTQLQKSTNWASACGNSVFHFPIALVIAMRASRSLAARGS